MVVGQNKHKEITCQLPHRQNIFDLENEVILLPVKIEVDAAKKWNPTT